MRLIPISYNGFPLNDLANIASKFQDPHMWSLASSDVSVVSRTGTFPAFGAKKLNERTIALNIAVMNCRPSVFRNTLTQNIDVYDRTMRTLVARDSDNGKLWSVQCTPTSLVCEDDYGKHWTAVFVIPEPIWICTTLKSETFTFDATPKTKQCTIMGNLETYPVFKIKPTVARTGGYNYKKYVTITDNFQNEAKGYPVVIITDTATPIAAGHMQADCDDLLVYVNGSIASRWIDTPNNANTKVWVVLAFSKQPTLTFGTVYLTDGTEDTTIAAGDSIASIGISNTTYTTGKGKKRKTHYTLENMPASGILQIDTEQFTFTGVDVKLGKFTGITRAVRGTSAANHAAAATIKWIQHDIVFVYGDLAASAPTADSAIEPVLNKNTSTNSSWVYTYFGTETGSRAGSFSPGVLKANGDQTMIYTGDYSAASEPHVDPYTSMGLSIEAYENKAKWKASTADLVWVLHHPAGITNVNWGGKKYMYKTWPKLSCLQRLGANNKWITVTDLAAPAVDTWTVFNSNDALGATYTDIRFRLQGSVTGLDSNKSAFQVTSLTLTLDATYVPTTSVGAEINTGYVIQTKILNNETGEFITLNVSFKINDTLVIDTLNRLVYRLSDNQSFLSGISFSTIRSNWLRLVPGTTGVNNLIFTEVGINGEEITIEWYDRNN